MALARLGVQVLPLANPLRRTLSSTTCWQLKQELLVNDASVQEQGASKKTSKAMRAYMDRSAKYAEFMQKQISEFEVGKRHLANMMGEDAEHYTQEDIDRAIRYLFPTGMFEKKARPLMRHPSEVFPQQKEAQFDEAGRPHHPLFYTLTPNLYMTMHDIVDMMNHLEKLESKNAVTGQLPDPGQKLTPLGSEWITIEELSKMLVETIRDVQYEQFVRAMNRLMEHPLSYHHKDFIFKHRQMHTVTSDVNTVPELAFDVSGRPYAEATGNRKWSRAQVTVRGRGSGRVTVNGTPLLHFFWRHGGRSGNQDVAQVMYPLQVTGLLDAVDVEAAVQYVGPSISGADGSPLPLVAPSSQAGALRYALSMALRGFVDADMRETMRLAGLLTKDVRTKERNKPGKKKARKGPTWKKR